MDTRRECHNCQLIYLTRSNWERRDVTNMCQSFPYGINIFLEREANRRSSHIYKGEA